MCEQAEVDERFRKKVRSNKSKGICSVDKTLFVTDVSAGEVKIVTRLGETVTFSEDSWLPLRHVWNSF